MAFMGIALAINQMLLYFGGMTPFNETIFLALASILIGIVIIEKGIKNGTLFFVSSALMALIIMPDKLNAAGYVFILGTYTVVKYHIERMNSLKKEILVKVMYFALVSLAASIAVNELFLNQSIMILLPVFVITLAVYDYGATVILTSYRNKFKPYN